MNFKRKIKQKFNFIIKVKYVSNNLEKKRKEKKPTRSTENIKFHVRKKPVIEGDTTKSVCYSKMPAGLYYFI